MGLRDNVQCLSWAYWKAHSELPISVTAEVLRAKIDRKSAISLQRGKFDPKFHVDGDVPRQSFSHG